MGGSWTESLAGTPSQQDSGSQLLLAVRELALMALKSSNLNGARLGCREITFLAHCW